MASPITATPLPLYTAIPDVPADLTAAVNALEKFVIPRFATSTARDAAIPAPIDGMVCYVTGTGFLKNVGGTTGGWQALYTIPAVPALNTGVVTVSYAASSGSSTATITFAGGRFASLPNVFVSANSGAAAATGTTYLVYNITASSATVGAYGQAIASARTLDIMWLAVDRGF